MMNLIQRIKDGATRATEKAQHAVEINKINSQVTSIEQEMDVHFLRMGQIFYEGYRAHDMSIAETEMTQLSKTCDALQDEIDGLRAKIAELKNARLCECGAVVGKDANFCPKCGRKMGKESVASRQAAAVREEVPSQAYPFDFLKDEEPDQDQGYPEQDREEYGEPVFTPEEKAAFDEEWERRRQEELDRERERQEQLDERIRYWKENNSGEEEAAPPAERLRELVKCQICNAELPRGSKWCPRCGAEQI